MRIFARLLIPSVLACMAALTSFGPVQAEERIALVVGNGAYQHAPPLRNPTNDARLMASALRQSGFKVTELIDADFNQMKRAMLTFGRKIRAKDIDAGLFYFAGHGLQVAGENYLVPVNARIDAEDEVELEALNVNAFLRVVNSAKTNINIVILDACRNNPFARSFRSTTRGLASVDAPKGTLIGYATSPGDVALDGQGANSPYTKALAEAITSLGNRPIESVFKATRRQVLAATDDRQVPWETSSIVGDFFFDQSAKSAAVAAAPATNAPKAEPDKPLHDGIAAAYAATEQLGTKQAWEAFINRYAAAPDPFYLDLAQQQLAALEPPPVRHLPSPVGNTSICARNSSRVAGGRVCATSVLDPQFGNRYGVTNLLDGNSNTAWVEGAKGDGIGQTLVVEFDTALKPREIALRNGYNKNRSIYTKNGRVKQLTLTTSTGESFRAKLGDRGDWQYLNLENLGQQVRWISLTIDSVYRGSKYRDTAITELRVQ